MRNTEQWRPTKVNLGPDGHLRVPGDPASLAAGSTLMATLIARWYREVLAQHARGVLVELGGGRMPYYALYRTLVAETWCTDWPQSLHEQAHADFFSDLNAGLPLRSESADTLLAADVLEHIYRPQALLAEMFRVLKPGGTALVNTPFLYWVHEAPHDYFRYTQHAWARMAADAGFEALRVDAIGGSVCVLADITGKLLHRAPLVGRPLVRAMQRAVLALHAPLPASASMPLFVGAVLRKP